MPVDEVDAREARLRGGSLAAALPTAGTSEGRQLRRWLTQLIVTERVVAAEAAARGVTAQDAPTEAELLPDVTARLEIGSIAAAALADPARGRCSPASPPRSTSATTTSLPTTPETRCGSPRRPRTATAGAPRRSPPRRWRRCVRSIAEHLRAAARRRAFRVWLDQRRAELVRLAPGYEHPGDPRQPDNTHRH